MRFSERDGVFLINGIRLGCFPVPFFLSVGFAFTLFFISSFVLIGSIFSCDMAFFYVDPPLIYEVKSLYTAVSGCINIRMGKLWGKLRRLNMLVLRRDLVNFPSGAKCLVGSRSKHIIAVN